jgi:transposase InsO family protein
VDSLPLLSPKQLKKNTNYYKHSRGVYNKKRVHPSIGYVTPKEFEKSEGRF